MLIKTDASIIKTRAWIKPTKISSAIKGVVPSTGTSMAMTSRRISPAIMLPNKRNVKEIILERSEMSSRMPTKKLMGLLKSKNFFKYLNPRYL